MKMPATKRQIHLGFTPDPFPEGTHICHLYNDDDLLRRFLHAYITSGIAEGEWVEHFPNVPTSEDLERIVAELGIRQFVDQGPGKFVMQPVLDWCCRDGKFDPDRHFERFRDTYRRSQVCGYAGARIAAEMTWASRGMPGSERLVEFEAGLNNLVKDVPITLHCYYDTRKFDGKTLFDVLNVHPIIVVQGQVMRNPFYVTPEQFFAQGNDTSRQ
jgi:MEDS: MEthanogen/methylotroph, DcmR Sensory domain